MSEKFGEYYYYPAIDGEGFDVLRGTGHACKLIRWHIDERGAIMECQRGHIADLESALADCMSMLEGLGAEDAPGYIAGKALLQTPDLLPDEAATDET